MGRGISGTTCPTEMVHLSKFAGFEQKMNENLFNIASQLQITTKFRIIIYKCPLDEGHFISSLSWLRFPAPLAFVRLERCLCPIILTASECYAINLQIADI